MIRKKKVETKNRVRREIPSHSISAQLQFVGSVETTDWLQCITVDDREQIINQIFDVNKKINLRMKIGALIVYLFRKECVAKKSMQKHSVSTPLLRSNA